MSISKTAILSLELIFPLVIHKPMTYAEPCEESKMKPFAERHLTVLTKSFVLNI